MPSGSFRDALGSSMQELGLETGPSGQPLCGSRTPASTPVPGPSNRSHLLCFSGIWGQTWLRLQGPEMAQTVSR